MHDLPFQVFLDRGGTFTDCVARDPATGELRATKVLSSDRAAVAAIRAALSLAPDAAVPPCDVRMGTTLGTNALLERRGARTALVITRGFGDLFEIGDQRRPELFALDIVRPPPLPALVVEVSSRATPDGAVLAAPDEAELASLVASLRAAAIESVAVVVLHATRAPALELRIGAALAAAGFAHVSLSHEVDGQPGLLARATTTVIDAYLTPMLRRHTEALLAELPGSRVRLMQTNGGLVDAVALRGRDAVLSGPAGGVVALGAIAKLAGAASVVGLDMGGTSTDVSRWDGALPRSLETTVAGLTLRTPSIDVHTVAAGGGSLCRFDGRALTVGPESAGAAPGPLCYGRPEATEVALTDVALVLGRIVPDRFPVPLDAKRAREGVATLAERVGRSADEVAAGLMEIAVDATAEAIRMVTVLRGLDPRRDALVVFGGAGGQYACAIAERLGMRRVLVPPFAGVLSALGMGLADERWHATIDARSAPLVDESLPTLWTELSRAENKGKEDLRRDERAIGVQTSLVVRIVGTDDSFDLPLLRPDSAADLAVRFREALAREHRDDTQDLALEIVAARVEVVRPVSDLEIRARVGDGSGELLRRTRLFAAGAWHDDVPVVAREALAVGEERPGPLIVVDDGTTLVVDPGFTLRVHASGMLDVEGASRTAAVAVGDAPDPVALTVYGRLFSSIAEQMGRVLARAASSVNIRERLDFSCAVFDATGELVANAPHIPVHLGAMRESVRGVTQAHPRLRRGEAFATNDPAAGGSHLPDITLVLPVFDDQDVLRAFVASRGHHADVGGVTPGSMPPFATTLDEEGVVLRALPHAFRESAAIDALAAARQPARDPAQNRRDLDAQLSSCLAGERLLREAAARHGDDALARAMRHVTDHAEASVRAAIAQLPRGRRTFADALDDGTPIVVAVEAWGDTLEIDFTGSGAEVESSLNAPRAVTVAAVLYVLRLLADRPIPLNGGCLRPVTLHIPARSILDPGPTRAVSAGNVETSQRVVDVLLGALNLAAASQGTMNNVTFGDQTFGYYETIAGGSGATSRAPGASCVHTHMTNTRITDPEILEARAPVRLREFSRRRGSGGSGAHRGGDGVVRELELLRPLRVSLVTERRVLAPFGLAGGGPAARGRNVLDGEELPGRATRDVEAGAILRIETPGGGGYG